MKKLLVIFIVLFFAYPCIAGNHTRHFLQEVLNNMEENYQHHIGVKPGRYEIYVNKDGREFVYDPIHKKPVDDPINQGSYNYFPYHMGIKHFIYDRYPWLHLGNTKNEKSTYQDRLNAWIDDFIVSYEKVCREQPALLKGSKASFDEEKLFSNMMERIFASFLKDEYIEKMLSSNPCKSIVSSKSKKKKDVLYIIQALKENFKNGPLSSFAMAIYFAKIPKPNQLK